MPKPAQFAAVNPRMSLAALHDRMIVFAQDARGGLIHVDAAQRGKACDCHCLACDEALIARHGDIKAHSFAHASGTECQFAIDAVLNRLAQELIAGAGRFVSPPLSLSASAAGPFGSIRREATIAACRLRVESAVVDRRVHKLRPSVVLTVAGHELLLELTYGHRLDAHKRAAIEALGMAAIEMHIGDGMFDTVEQFARQLLEDASGKHWIVNPKGHAIQAGLEAGVAADLAEQRLRQAREQDAARALRERQLQETLAQKWEMQARRDSLLRQASGLAQERAYADRQEPVPPRRPTLQYRLRDGAVLLQHERDGGILLVPETGNEAVLHVFVELGLQHSAERGGYLAAQDQLQDIVLAMRPFQLAVKSV